MNIDLISDMLTRLKNASKAKHSFTRIKNNLINLTILKILESENYIKNYKIKNNEILVFLSYKGWWIKKPYFSKINRISKPGQKIFSGYKNFFNVLKPLKYNQGLAIVSTSSGIMSHLKAIDLKKGGEILCYIE
jgi:small subunit ribosomal protein S8